jgi:membrane protein insertase Oxa1/YidC/SpoIIIJ
MKKNILSFSALLIVLASCGRSAVCSCSDLMLEMSKEMRQVKGDYTKLEAIQKKYEADFKKCEKLEEGKSEVEKKKMQEEFKACDSYKEMEKLMKAE